MSRCTIHVSDALSALREMETASVHTCVTSPPYFGLRDYGAEGQIGLERTPAEYVARLVEVFSEVWRVLRDDGTAWLNLGDSYAANRGYQVPDNKWQDVGNSRGMRAADYGLKPKDLCGIPWRVAFALQDAGWYLRSEIIWSKPNPMPESVTDRPTRAHEQIFLLSKRASYYYDTEAVREPVAPSQVGRARADAIGGASWQERGQHSAGGVYRSGNAARKIANGADGQRPADHLGSGVPWEDTDGKRNRRSVWNIATAPFPGAHFAVFPPALVTPCILAGCPPGGTVLDPFGGAGTTAVVALGYGRNAVLCELNPGYAEMAAERVRADAPLLNEVTLLRPAVAA